MKNEYIQLVVVTYHITITILLHLITYLIEYHSPNGTEPIGTSSARHGGFI